MSSASEILHRHGIQLRSNYLYLDGHVANAEPKNARSAIDPWDVTR